MYEVVRLSSSVNNNANHFMICSFYFTEYTKFYHSPVLKPTYREIYKHGTFTFVVLVQISDISENRSNYEISKSSKRCHVMLCLLLRNQLHKFQTSGVSKSSGPYYRRLAMFNTQLIQAIKVYI